MQTQSPPVAAQYEITVPTSFAGLAATLAVPTDAHALVLVAQGGGGAKELRHGKRATDVLHGAGIATLLFDLLTARENRVYLRRFDVDVLTERLLDATQWIRLRREFADLPLGYFCSGTGAAAAMRAAAKLTDGVCAVVSLGGRPDLALEVLPRVTAPTLFIVGGLDSSALGMNRRAYDLLTAARERDLAVVEGASYVFEEPSKMEEAAALAKSWVEKYAL